MNLFIIFATITFGDAGSLRREYKRRFADNKTGMAGG